VAFFEVTAAVAGLATIVPVTLHVVKDWLAVRRSHITISVTRSDGDKLTVSGSNINSAELTRLLTEVLGAGEVSKGESFSDGESQ
jgi:hypothetical protein